MDESKNRTKSTKQIVIEEELHHMLKLKAAASRISIKTLIEGFLADALAVEN